ncbi:MAG: DoxX family membrane protein [Chloroherpetonaceae bacterium]|nr:DoxX family membrane protein [Chloroherpetonaceae bacterium]
MNVTATLANQGGENFSWKRLKFSEHPLKALGILFLLVNRYFLAIFYIYGTWHKIVKEWMWTDVLKVHFQQRLAEIGPGSFPALYLEYFAIPLWYPIAAIVTLGELYVAVGLTLGWTTRMSAAFSLFLLINFGLGAFYNIWIPILSVCSILVMITPTGKWFGFDRRLMKKYPESIWYC